MFENVQLRNLSNAEDSYVVCVTISGLIFQNAGVCFEFKNAEIFFNVLFLLKLNAEKSVRTQS